MSIKRTMITPYLGTNLDWIDHEAKRSREADTEAEVIHHAAVRCGSECGDSYSYESNAERASHARGHVPGDAVRRESRRNGTTSHRHDHRSERDTPASPC